jgi:guanylate kinase
MKIPRRYLKMTGKLFVISGPSGVGKGTLVNKILEENKELYLSVSATTRSKRDGEIEGINYYFKTKEEFLKMTEENEFLEWATFCENSYGTPKRPVFDKLNEGKDVILEIEIQGAMQVKKNMPSCVLLFIAPPSKEELIRRLKGRGTETDEVIKLRVETATKEFKVAKEYDYIIVNDDIEKATDDILSVIKAEKCKKERIIDELEVLK